jgi:peptidoglycan/LPS O-acetylase OafA/YrhL
MRRLLPASALTLLVTLAAGILLSAPHELEFAARAARAMAVYLSNVFFGINSADYFAPDVETNPMLHTWSLAVEEQFYLFWPLLIALGLQRMRSKKALLALLTGLTAVSFAACVVLTAKGGTFAFYQLPARAWEFGIGGLGALAGTWTKRLPQSVWRITGWAGVVTILGSTVFIREGRGFPGWIAAIPTAGTMAALFSGAVLPGSGVGRLLNIRPLQILGSLSYSWYLWHWPFLVFATAIMPNISIPGKLAAATASLAVAAVAHRFVENPIRFHPFLIQRPKHSLALGGALTLVSLVASGIALRIAGTQAKSPELSALTSAVNDISRLPRDRCVSMGFSTEVKLCEFGDTGSSRRVVLFGDSHAIQWFNPLQRMADAQGWRLTTIVKSGCPSADIDTPGPHGFSAKCAAWRSEAIKRIQMLRPTLVFIGNASIYLEGRGSRASSQGISLEDWRNGYRRILEPLSSQGLRVAVMHDIPTSHFDIPTCIARARKNSWYPSQACELDKAAAVSAPMFEAERDAANGLAKVHFLDLTERLCPGQRCPVVADGQVMYRDSNHLTGSFADRLQPELDRLLAPLMAGSEQGFTESIEKFHLGN